MTSPKTPPLRTDETGKHVRSDSPVDRPAQNVDIEEFDEKGPANSLEEDDDDRHEKRPEGPYKDPGEEERQGDVK